MTFALGRCLDVCSCSFCSVGAHVGSALLLGSLSFISLRGSVLVQCVLDSRAFRFFVGATFVRFLFWVCLMRTWASAIISGHVSLSPLFRVTLSRSVLYSLTFWYCGGICCIYSFLSCRTGTWVWMDVTSRSVRWHCTVWTTMRLQWLVT